MSPDASFGKAVQTSSTVFLQYKTERHLKVLEFVFAVGLEIISNIHTEQSVKNTVMAYA